MTARRVLLDFLRLQADAALALPELLFSAAGGRFLERVAKRAPVPRPVIVVPGFAAPESSYRPLVRFLERRGYVATTFQPGVPVGEAVPRFVRGMRRTLGQLIPRLADAHGEAVALVGHSAGGMYVREYAALHPQDIDRVITLGSPTHDPADPAQHNRALEVLVSRVSKLDGFGGMSGEGLLHWPVSRPPLPFVAICSPIDAAVSEEAALLRQEVVAPRRGQYPRENVRVACSHFAMGYSVLVKLVIADRLAADPRDWRRFDPAEYFPRARAPLRELMFPRVAH